ncbi:LysR family transcriptional regulator [Acuticoccus sediminis]|uniref:LysR family transcriptional regulator n=1 Tax=Acuticoccus sediminis TaxID=2184697 RepID=A0A8B2NR20_9HYPH|nr:LysR family transcriptional regulator [Acuticoccus sediminis]RAI00760.1 LysR family transcriptional regulator [Acuticoccus sediminis]
MDRFEAMSILMQVVEKGGFTAAAKASGMPLASVSRKVAELEKHLGTRLLLRSTRSVVLTQAGVAYVAAARRILEEVEEAERAASGEYTTPRGELVVTAPVLFGRLHVLPVVTDFLAAYADISVRLLLSDQNLHLIEEHVDVGVRIGALPDSGLIATRVGTMRMVVCAAPDVIDRYGTPGEPPDLAGIPIVNFERLSPSATWTFHRADRADMVSVPVMPRLTVTTAEAAVEAAARGAGATRVFLYQAAEEVRRQRLRILLPDFEPPAVPVHLIHAGDRDLPLKTRTFLDFAAERLREGLRELATLT